MCLMNNISLTKKSISVTNPGAIPIPEIEKGFQFGDSVMYAIPPRQENETLNILLRSGLPVSQFCNFDLTTDVAAKGGGGVEGEGVSLVS